MLEVLSNIGFDWQVALANFINFLIIFWILKKWVFGPVGKIISERKEKIQAGIDQAQQSETELLVAKQKAEEEIKAARSQANQIVADAKEVADEQIAHAKEKASNEATAIIEKAHTQIEKDKVQMEKELFEQTAGLIALGVQKILDEEVTESKNSELSNRALDILNAQK
ncbi:MAG: F0F1 ATP synthase subunit B [Candidatus Pacebacteria bacterium]|nr:F0F1 ATP synthase subunit B [Candidatus Paceibacterota bacterium]